ncbi:carboxymuconolactone decarboxylase family protein [Kineosporia succinea]|uniref:4-carboxymuconolactone decarboxylase n=1 Tax=Kineosporia succinea TaxID=84632 RepID=A0ABT9PAU8_9ACTN|nr:carboxymuconolactone decarboxylase family protein [Kineosporia succinea]MDP9829822.1 4-carboxymuconolactone decarboxylase [Kineosporia succinea]
MTTAQPSSLETTDPEFTAIARALGDQVTTVADLPEATRFVLQLGAVIATGAHATYRSLLEAALDGPLDPVQVKEVVYQSVPYVGQARAVDALQMTNEVLTARGVHLPLPGQSTTTPGTRLDEGRAVQERIVGPDRVAAIYDGTPADQAHIPVLLSAHCFGDHYTRTGLDVGTRELLTLAILVALGGADPQVKGHVAGNLTIGNERGTLVAAVTVLLPYVGYPRTLNALRAIDEIAPAGTV